MNSYIHYRLGDLDIPIKIIEERRRNARAAFGKDAILLRIPIKSGNSVKLKHIEWVKSWLTNIFDRRPFVFERYRPVEYCNGQIIETICNIYSIKIDSTTSNSPKVQLTGSELHIDLPSHFDNNEKEIGKKVSACISRDHIDWIQDRVHFLNKEHFQETIQKISLRYAETRWGSCNHNGNISISTRALLAPNEILDHIIIHELAHLKEMNHSPAFWNMVSKADPNHVKNDKWLQKYGHTLKF